MYACKRDDIRIVATGTDSRKVINDANQRKSFRGTWIAFLLVTLQGPELLAPTHDIEIERRRQVLAARASAKSVIASRLELKTSTSVN